MHGHCRRWVGNQPLASPDPSCRLTRVWGRGAARFNQTNPSFGPVQGGGPTIWMGGTAPTIFQDKLYVVTGECFSQLNMPGASHASCTVMFGSAFCPGMRKSQSL